jgi:hypothetical protein
MSQITIVSTPLIKPTITTHTRVKLRRYFVREEGEEFIVGCPDQGAYLAIPSPGVEAMRLLEAGKTVGEVGEQVRDVDGSALDIVDFLKTLARYGFIAEIDGRSLAHDDQDNNQALANQFRWLTGAHLRWVYHPWAAWIHGAIIVLVVILLWQYPNYIPQSQDYFFHPWYTLNILVIVATTWLSLILHELSHLAAARSMGIDGHISIGRRLYTLVVQCEMEHMFQLPRQQRLMIYLAGIFVNLWIFFIALSLLIWQSTQLPTTLANFLQLVMLVQWYSVAWQFRFYMQTDIYYVVSDLLYAKNLIEDAQHFLANLFARLRRRPAPYDLSALPRRERRDVQLYALFYVVGVGVAIATLVFYIIPFVTTMFIGAVSVLSQGAAAPLDRMVDACIVLFFIGLNIAFLLLVIGRERLERIRQTVMRTRTNATLE